MFRPSDQSSATVTDPYVYGTLTSAGFHPTALVNGSPGATIHSCMSYSSNPHAGVAPLHLAAATAGGGGGGLQYASPFATAVNSFEGLLPAGSLLPQSLPNGTDSNSPNGSWCLYVGNLAPDTDDATLWRLFGPYGAVRSVKVIRDANSGRCRGFGFVNMNNYPEAVLAIQQVNGLVL